ncbi:MAG: class I SAM-dependent methyltransferase [Planctomycetales bacterium]|nr:class I SAM-dependent methyltransferase [Planctomycetales bacterium]
MGITRFASKLKRSIKKRLPGYEPIPGNKAIKVEAAEDVPFLVPTAKLHEIFDSADVAEVTMLPRLIRSHKWAMPEHELLTLGALTKILQPKLVVEFGTFMGGSTLSMAANMPADGKIVTIDLDPAARSTHVHGMGVGLSQFDVGCLFRGTRYASMIEQRFANTVEFHDRDLLDAADLVFVDADHTYEFAKRDTRTAMTFVKSTGTILWHDYTWEPKNPECVGVTKTVNEFWEQFGCCSQIAGTRFALYTPQLAGRQSAAA